MAKVNLLTMHYVDNNGSFFQTYATCKILESLGHEVTIINLQDKKWHIGRWKKKGSYYMLLRYIRFWICRKKFYPKMTRLMFTVNPESIPEADYYIVGSDQVWNYNITYYDFLSYFLSFAPEGMKRIALASSFGQNWDTDASITEKVKNELHKFEAISVREDTAVRICKDIFGVNAEQVVDPSLALGDYSEFLTKKNIKKSYLGCFTLNSEGSTLSIARAMAKKMQLPIVCTNSLPKKGMKSGLLFWENPLDWINVIYNSNFFIADSFHGVVFCIILNKPFIATVNNEKKISRIESVLRVFGLENRLIRSIEELDDKFEELTSPIDWNCINDTLKNKQSEFNNFIINNIK